MMHAFGSGHATKPYKVLQLLVHYPYATCRTGSDMNYCTHVCK